MATGIVVSVNPARRGDTLMAATLATDTVLSVKTVIAFGDEDGGWVKIGEAGPFEYLSADESTNTITLAAQVGAVYEAGLDVNLFDPTVVGGGHDVVEYVASVRRESGGEPFPATIDHTTIPLSDVLNLEGARVEVEQASDDAWYVSRVIAREPVIGNVDIVGARFLTATEGPRVVVQPLQSGDTTGGSVLVYSGNTAEEYPGYLQGSETLLGGSNFVLQTILGGPKIDSASDFPRVVLSVTEFSGVATSFVAVNGDTFQVNADSIIFASGAAQALEIGPSPTGVNGPYLQRENGATGLSFGTARLNCVDDGGTYVNIAAAAFVVASDTRIKSDISPVVDAGEIVDSIEPDDYTLTASGKQTRGFMAQKVAPHLPCAVQKGEDGYLSVDTYPMIATLWAALREERAARLKLEDRMTAIEAALAGR